MFSFFSFLTLIFLLFLVIGLLRPTLFASFLKRVSEGRNIVLLFCAFAILSFIGIFASNSSIQNKELVHKISIEPALESESEEAIQEEEEIDPLPEQPISTASIVNEEETVAPGSLPNPSAEYYSIVVIVDGDTFKVNIDGTTETVRLIGIDTPESVDPRRPVECFGREAMNRAKELLNGKKVMLEADPTQGERDKYQRLLRYAWLEGGMLFNQQMIADGYAMEYTYDIPYTYQIEFKRAETEARNAKRGLWADEACVSEVPKTQDSLAAQPSGHTFYTSSHYSAKLYYCDTGAWKNLSAKYRKSFSSEKELLEKYSRTLHEPCI